MREATTDYPNCTHGQSRQRGRKIWYLHEYVLDGRGIYWCMYCLNEGKLPKHTGFKPKQKSHLALRAEAYGLTQEQLRVLIDKFNHSCHLCFSPFEKFVVDHDHSCCPPGLSAFAEDSVRGCGKCVRGLLDYRCNSRLGFLGDTLEGLLQNGDPHDPWFALAETYLRRYEDATILG